MPEEDPVKIYRDRQGLRIDAAVGYQVLADFLQTDGAFARSLLPALAAGVSDEVSGNAFHVTMTEESVTLEHSYTAAASLTVPRSLFHQTLQEYDAAVGRMT